MIRRDFLKKCGLIAAGTALNDPFAMANDLMISPSGDEGNFNVKFRSLKPQTSKQITVVIIGAGNRGRLYASYAKMFPENVKVVGVSDILESRRHDMADKHNVPQENRFGHYNEVFTRPKFADAVVIATPDDRHVEPCLKAMELGYDVLLEKPAAPTEKECR